MKIILCKLLVFVPKVYLVGMLGIIVLLLSLIASPIQAQPATTPLLKFSIYLSAPEVAPNEKTNLIIEATNIGQTSVENYIFQLFLTEGLSIAADPIPHDLYEPLLTQTLNFSPGSTETLVVPLYVSETATPLEAVALIHESEMIARLEVPISGTIETLNPESDYNMPVAPEVSCPAPPLLSSVGGAALNALNDYYFGGDYTAGAYFSRLTNCNKFEGDWILDVGNVTSATPSTTAEEFYEMVGDLIRDTEYTFSLSTLGFDTHDEVGELNLVKQYLAPAILDLHNNTPVNGPYPLLRFLYSEGDVPFLADYDEPAQVYADLTANLPEDSSTWRVSIAVATIGEVPLDPWNHSKIAVRDYRQAIVGGMNWELNYVLPVNIDGNGHNPTVVINGYTYNVHRLYDLSLKVEGDSANASGVFFDKLWKRTIDPLFPHLGDDCKTSWETNPPGPWIWLHDCPLDQVPEYAPNDNQIPNYYIDQAHRVFGLGRGHVEWGASPLELGADKAVLAAFEAAEETIFISQHQLSRPDPADDPFFTPEVVEALVHAIVDNDVNVKVVLSEPWGTPEQLPSPDSIHAVYDALTWEIFNYTVEQYGPLPVDPEEWGMHYDALCGLEFRPFRVSQFSYPENLEHIYHTHSKFFMVDEQVFYVASQNLYPSAIGETSGAELNEYGFLVDDSVLTAQMQEQYWNPIWQAAIFWADFEPEQVMDDWHCLNGEAVYGPTAVELVGWDVVGEGDGKIKVTWETATELGTSHFNIYRNTSPDVAAWEQVASVLAEGGPTIGASYEWIDNNVSDGVLYYYWLEEVEQDGDTELWGPKATTSDPPLFLDLGLGSAAIQELGNGDYEVYVTSENGGTVQAENFPIGLAVSPLGGNGLIYFRTCIDQLDPGQSITKHFLVTVPFDVLIAQVNPDGGEIPPTCPHLGGEIDDGHENNSRLYDLDNISCPPGLALPDNHAVANATTTLFWGKCTASTQYELQITQLNDGASLTIPMGDYFSFPLGIVNPAFFQSRQQYSWKVRACSAGNCSNWSEERTFWWLESPPEIIFVHPPFLVRDEESPQPLRITIQARDADNPQLTWSIENIGGTDIGGMNLMSNGRSAVIEWTPNETQGPSTNAIRVTVSDGISSDSEELTIDVYEINRAPVLNPIGNKQGTVRDEMIFALSAVDPDIPANPLHYNLVNSALPEGATFDTVTGIFQWTPDYDQVGVYDLTFEVTDGNLVDSETIQLTVQEVFQQPVSLSISQPVPQQQNPTVAYSPEYGNYLIVWQENNNGQWEIWGQYVDSVTMERASFLIGTNGIRPVVAYSSSDNVYLVVWESSEPVKVDVQGTLWSGKQLWARSVPPNDSPPGSSPFAVYTYSPSIGSGEQPSITFNESSSEFLVTWQSPPGRIGLNSDWGRVYAQRVSSSMVLGERITIFSNRFSPINSMIGTAVNGTFLVAWQDARGGAQAIYGRILTSNGAPSGSDFMISGVEKGHSLMPKLAWNSITGSYMVVWQNSGIVYGRLLDVNGMPLSHITTISEIAGATTSSITAVANGWIVVWSHQLAIDPQEGGDANLYGQWIHSNGSLNEDNFTLVSSQGDQKLPVLASDPISGYYLAAWQDNRTMNDGVFFAITH